MVLLIASIIAFNIVAFKMNKKITPSQVLQIWTFTIAFQMIFDLIVEFKHHFYWYFTPAIEWEGLLPRLFLIPPVNIIFLNGYPFSKGILKKMVYLLFFVAGIILYEMAALLPEPWGYFNYGKWKIWYSVIVDPFLLLALVLFYKLLILLEEKSFLQKKY
ncbi:hypothetical protein DFO70_102223 [Cytobacillus firmus]|uniref:Uncharacterized protein n=2 Tax=Cytobacillus TaxID=2675230 RepID=A0A366K417_CYTFI|nr:MULTISPECIES: hypothetical protein [Cytobacillus]RBP95898.1 hypothetical protein DFO70_102223 [Cytobacillus firmus]TDX44811.1 hypothetical protein DFO72_103223 [Cytobacillus oceanisediminis]